MTQRGRLDRSDTLQALTPDDVVRSTVEFGVAAIIDLRLAREVAGERQGPLAGFVGVRHINTPLQMASADKLRAEGVDDEAIVAGKPFSACCGRRSFAPGCRL